MRKGAEAAITTTAAPQISFVWMLFGKVMAVHMIGGREGIHGRNRIPQENNGRNVVRQEREHGNVGFLFFPGNHEFATDKCTCRSRTFQHGRHTRHRVLRWI